MTRRMQQITDEEADLVACPVLVVKEWKLKQLIFVCALTTLWNSSQSDAPKSRAMRRHPYIALITVLLALTATLPTRAQTPALDFIAIETRSDAPSCLLSGGVFAINKNLESRIFVTIKVDSDFPHFIWLDNKQSPITYPRPTFPGILLHPGEQKRIGCVSLVVVGPNHSEAFALGYQYTKVGAYYPRPDLVIPDNDKPEDFVRFHQYKNEFFPISACPLPGMNAVEIITMFNLHPTKTIAVTYTNSTPGRRPEESKNIPPLAATSVACVNEWQNINFTKFVFIQ